MITREEVKSRIVPILDNHTWDLDTNNINEDNSFSKDLGFDSFDEIEVIIDTENEFNISIEEKDLPQVLTIKSFIDCVFNKLSNK